MEADQIVSINYAEYRECKVCARWINYWCEDDRMEECWNKTTKVKHWLWGDDETVCGRSVEGKNWLFRV